MEWMLGSTFTSMPSVLKSSTTGISLSAKAVDWAEKEEALKYIHILKANEHEMEVLTQCSDPYDAAVKLADWGVKEVLLTLGDKGSLIYVDERFYEIPAYPVENVADATGCGDTQVMIKALTEGKETIDIMAAGTAMRFLTAYLSVTPGERTITGTARMQQRPIQILVNALRELGAEIEYTRNEGYPPLRIKGAELKGNEITLKGNVSSQYISALLMIGPALKDGLTLHLSGEIISRPYINLTLQLMQDFGAKAAWTSPNSISVAPQLYQSIPFKVESDWSAASYWYQIAALSPKAEIELLGLFPNSYQGYSARHR